MVSLARHSYRRIIVKAISYLDIVVIINEMLINCVLEYDFGQNLSQFFAP